MAEDLSWTPENMDSLEDVVDIRGMCRHPDEGQILINIDAPSSFNCWRMLKEVERTGLVGDLLMSLMHLDFQ